VESEFSHNTEVIFKVYGTGTKSVHWCNDEGWCDAIFGLAGFMDMAVLDPKNRKLLTAIVNKHVSVPSSSLLLDCMGPGI
jgi:hypothetical protein